MHSARAPAEHEISKEWTAAVGIMVQVTVGQLFRLRQMDSLAARPTIHDASGSGKLKCQIQMDFDLSVLCRAASARDRKKHMARPTFPT